MIHKPRASLVAQLVKNPPAMWEIWVPSLGWEDPLEKGKATHCSILAWRILQSMAKSQSRLINRLSLSPEAGREARNRFLLSPQKEPTLPILWLQMSSLKNCQKINFCCLNYVAVVLSYSSSTKLIDRRYKELKLGLPWWLGGKESTCQCRKCGVDPWSGKIPHAAQRLSLCAVTTEHVH